MGHPEMLQAQKEWSSKLTLNVSMLWLACLVLNSFKAGELLVHLGFFVYR
jgi:hypothetical protein